MTATLGLRAHSGWAVTVAISDGSAILQRRIVMTEGPGDPSKQPYHAAEQMQLPQAEAFLQRTEKSAVEKAAAAVKDVIASLAGQGYRERSGSSAQIRPSASGTRANSRGASTNPHGGGNVLSGCADQRAQGLRPRCRGNSGK